MQQPAKNWWVRWDWNTFEVCNISICLFFSHLLTTWIYRYTQTLTNKFPLVSMFTALLTILNQSGEELVCCKHWNLSKSFVAVGLSMVLSSSYVLYFMNLLLLVIQNQSRNSRSEHVDAWERAASDKHKAQISLSARWQIPTKVSAWFKRTGAARSYHIVSLQCSIEGTLFLMRAAAAATEPTQALNTGRPLAVVELLLNLRHVPCTAGTGWTFANVPKLCLKQSTAPTWSTVLQIQHWIVSPRCSSYPLPWWFSTWMKFQFEKAFICLL